MSIETYFEEDRDSLDPDEKIIHRAHRRFDHAEEKEAYSRQMFMSDIKFANADPINGYQWPTDLRNNRDVDDRPCLTINKTKQHCLQIINDQKTNKPAMMARAVSNGSTKESADVMSAIFHHIEYISNAPDAYATAIEHQVEGGFGYWRVVTDYVSDDSFDQELFIKRIPDPMQVYIDPDCMELDKSDMKFALIFEDMPKDKVRALYPDRKDLWDANTVFGEASNSWNTKDYTRTAEYFEVEEKETKLCGWPDPMSGEFTTMFRDEIHSEVYKEVKSYDGFRERPVSKKTVMWYHILGDEIVDRTEWLGTTIPIVALYGEEKVIEGTVDRRSHTRLMLDPQRQLNYWASAATEQVALQTKSPYTAPARAISGFEGYWETANKVNHAVLPWNDIDQDGNPIAKPERIEPPVMSDAYVKGMEMAKQDMMQVSGQFESMMGAPSNERSGTAIFARERQGDNATYHFIDALSRAIRRTGRIILDIIPKLYDSKRIMQIMAEDGQSYELEVNPAEAQAYRKKVNHLGQTVGHIFNPTVGKYEVEADVGPDYGTKRQQAFDAFKLILSQAPEFASLVGDIMLKAGDFPGADEAAERLRRMVPPQALGEGPPPQVQQLQQQLQESQNALSKMALQVSTANLKLKGKDEMRDIDAYKAESDRLKALAGLIQPATPPQAPKAPGEGSNPAPAPAADANDGIRRLVEQLVADALATHITQIQKANAGELAKEGGAVSQGMSNPSGGMQGNPKSG